jgi:hypothetical protein
MGKSKMRHEQLTRTDSYTKVGIPAAWPTSPQLAPLPAQEIEPAPAAEPMSPTPSAPDVPAAVGGMIAASYVMLVGTFALATVASAYSVYMITISFVCLAAYFTVPWLFLRQEPKSGRRPSLDRFMRDGMDTFTGHSSGGAALVQMMIVPVLLTLGAAGMGIAAAIIM